jgi:hypothetical protein
MRANRSLKWSTKWYTRSKFLPTKGFDIGYQNATRGY